MSKITKEEADIIQCAISNLLSEGVLEYITQAELFTLINSVTSNFKKPKDNSSKLKICNTFIEDFCRTEEYSDIIYKFFIKLVKKLTPYNVKALDQKNLDRDVKKALAIVEKYTKTIAGTNEIEKHTINIKSFKEGAVKSLNDKDYKEVISYSYSLLESSLKQVLNNNNAEQDISKKTLQELFSLFKKTFNSIKNKDKNKKILWSAFSQIILVINDIRNNNSISHGSSLDQYKAIDENIATVVLNSAITISEFILKSQINNGDTNDDINNLKELLNLESEINSV